LRARLLAVLALGAVTDTAGAQLPLSPLDVRVPMPPTAVPAAGKRQLVYELRVTNISGRDKAIVGLEVFAGSGSVAAWAGQELDRLIQRVQAGTSTDRKIIASGRQLLFFLLVALDSARTAAVLEHRFYLADSIGGARRDTVRGVMVPIRTGPLPVLGSPFAGGTWLAGNGPGNTSGHRRTIIPLDGVARVPQRFGTDWLKLGPNGELFVGDSTKNESWPGYRQPLLAVGPGTIVAAKDGIPDNVPLAPARAVPITLETVGGNHVIVDLGEGRYAFYAHLVPGSLKVKVGDRVNRGQVLGLLGNSGNSDAPHLHLHLGDAPSPLGTEGQPFVFDRFVKLGEVPPFTDVPARITVPTGSGTTVRHELPLDNWIVRFPETR
jgi:murein DD-endopeptidase